MKARLRIFAYLLLAFSLVAIGLPTYGAGAASGTGESKAQSTAGSDCPFHQAAALDADAFAIDIETPDHDCCGPDCRCACASLSMLALQRFQTPLTPFAASLPHSANSLLAVVYGSRLLRPPQA